MPPFSSLSMRSTVARSSQVGHDGTAGKRYAHMREMDMQTKTCTGGEIDTRDRHAHVGEMDMIAGEIAIHMGERHRNVGEIDTHVAYEVGEIDKRYRHAHVGEMDMRKYEREMHMWERWTCESMREMYM